MQINTILHLFTPYIQKEMKGLSENLNKTWDFRQFEDGVRELMNQLEACITMCVLEELLTDFNFLMQLKRLAGKLGMRFKEYRTLHMRIGNGLQISMITPYFIKVKPKRGRKKRGQMGGGSISDWRFWAF